MAPDPRRWGGKAHGHPWGNPGERDGAHYEQRLITRVFQGPWELWREPGRGQRPSVCLPTPQLSPPGCQTTSTLQTPPPALPRHRGHTQPRGPCPPRTRQLLGLQAAPASSPALTRSDKSRKPGVSLGRLLLSHPVLGEWGQPTSGQPGPLWSMCCAQPPPKESGAEGGK